MTKYLTLLALSLTAYTAQAALTLEINTVNQTVSLWGSDTGQSFGVQDGDYTQTTTWSYAPGGVYSFDYDTLTLSNSITDSDPTVELQVYTSGAILLQVQETSASSMPPIIELIEGTGITTSYTSLSEDAISTLENFSQSSMPVFEGFNYSDMTVVRIVGVPEPSSTSLALGTLGLAALLCYRRKRA